MGRTTVNYYVNKLRYKLVRLKIELEYRKHGRGDPRMIERRTPKKMLTTLRKEEESEESEIEVNAIGHDPQEEEVFVDQNEFRGFSSMENYEEHKILHNRYPYNTAAKYSHYFSSTPSLNEGAIIYRLEQTVRRTVRSAPASNSSKESNFIENFDQAYQASSHYDKQSPEHAQCCCGCHKPRSAATSFIATEELPGNNANHYGADNVQELHSVPNSSAATITTTTSTNKSFDKRALSDRHLFNFRKRRFHLVPSPILECNSSETRTPQATPSPNKQQSSLKPFRDTMAVGSFVGQSCSSLADTKSANNAPPSSNEQRQDSITTGVTETSNGSVPEAKARKSKHITQTKDKVWNKVFSDMSLQAALVSLGATDSNQKPKVLAVPPPTTSQEGMEAKNKLQKYYSNPTEIVNVAKKRTEPVSNSDNSANFNGSNVERIDSHKDKASFSLREYEASTIPPVKPVNAKALVDRKLFLEDPPSVKENTGEKKPFAFLQSLGKEREVSGATSHNMFSLRSSNTLEAPKTAKSVPGSILTKSRPLTPNSEFAKADESFLNYNDLLSDYDIDISYATDENGI